LGREFKDATEGIKGIEGTEVTEGIEETHVVSESATEPKSVLEAVACCLPQRENDNHRCLFKLARALYTIQLNQKIKDDSTVRSMQREAFDLWWERAKGFARTGRSRECYWEEFLEARADVKYPIGGATLKQALERAKQSNPPLIAVQNFTDAKLLLLASLCRELQKINYPRPFFLDCRSAATAIALPDPTAAHRYFKRLKAVRILKEHEKGNQKKPTKFYYLLPLDEGSITNAEPITRERANSSQKTSGKAGGLIL